MKQLIILIFLLCLTGVNLFARPISYSGGSTIMSMNGPLKNSIHAHYSPTYKYSVGYKTEYIRRSQTALNGIQLNNLLKRWNLPAAQGNLYLKSSAGTVQKSGEDEVYGFIGMAGDFETRKYFASYENRYYKSDGNILNQFEQSARVGVAPYVAEYGNLHTWLMLQISHQPKFKGYQQIITTPLIRLFKGLHMAEFGASSNKTVFFNFIARF